MTGGQKNNKNPTDELFEIFFYKMVNFQKKCFLYPQTFKYTKVEPVFIISLALEKWYKNLNTESFITELKRKTDSKFLPTFLKTREQVYQNVNSQTSDVDYFKKNN